MRLFFAVVLAASAGAQSLPLDHLLQVEHARSHRASSTAADPNSNRDLFHLPAGETKVLAELQGPGIIRHVWLTFPEARPSWLARDGSAAPDELVLRMYWDGATEPAVEAPVGDFFAVGFGQRREVRSAVVQVQEGDSYNCFWPMPFLHSARITLTNESTHRLGSTYYHIDWEERALPERTPRFHARYRRDFPARKGEDYLIPDLEGEGHYVGTVLSVRSRSPSWFGEGDDRFYIDGETTASIQGTGTEDYFLSAWGLAEHGFPYAGTPLFTGHHGQLGQMISSYRWHLLDPVRFAKSLRVTIEHKGWVEGDEKPDGKVDGHTERFDDFASVAFWYQLGKAKAWEPLPPATGRKPPSLDWIIEGKMMLATARVEGGEASLQAGYDWTGAGQIFFQAREPAASLEVDFEVAAEEYRALVLRLTYSYDYGTWRVLLDGKERAARVDLYAQDTHTDELILGSQKLAPGKHTLRFEAAGRAATSQGGFLGLDSVRLRERVPPR